MTILDKGIRRPVSREGCTDGEGEKLADVKRAEMGFGAGCNKTRVHRKGDPPCVDGHHLSGAPNEIKGQDGTSSSLEVRSVNSFRRL